MGVLVTILLFGVQLAASYFATRMAGKEMEGKSMESSIPFLKLVYCTSNIVF
jgi:hypothetical protein